MTTPIVNKDVIVKNTTECKYCSGYGVLYIKYGETNYDRDLCPKCNGMGTLPNPDWLDEMLRGVKPLSEIKYD